MKNLEFDYSKLKGRITEKFGSYKNLVPHLSYGESSLSAKLNNNSRFSQPDMLELANVLEIDDKSFAAYFFKLRVRKNELKEAQK